MQGVRFDSKPSQDGDKDKKRRKKEKKKFVFGAGFEPTTLRSRGVGLGGQVGCERRSKVFVKIQKKKKLRGGWVGVGGGSDQGLGWGRWG